MLASRIPRISHGGAEAEGSAEGGVDGKGKHRTKGSQWLFLCALAAAVLFFQAAVYTWMHTAITASPARHAHADADELPRDRGGGGRPARARSTRVQIELEDEDEEEKEKEEKEEEAEEEEAPVASVLLAVPTVPVSTPTVPAVPAVPAAPAALSVPAAPATLATPAAPAAPAAPPPPAAPASEATPLAVPFEPRHREWRDAVVGGMRHAWNGYVKCAWGADEYMPHTCRAKSSVWGGMGMTILDSLDTLWLMEMTEEFVKGFEFVSNPSLLSFDRLASAVSTFETGIRALGGLLSAHSLMAREEARETGKAVGKAAGKKGKAGVILAKAVDLGDRLLRAFNTPTGLPTMRVDLSAGGGGGGGGGGRSTLADVGSMQLELRYLAKASGQPKYATAANRVAQWGYERLRSSGNGLLGVNIDVQSGMASGHLSMGGSGDSFYEYLIKSFIQGGVREPKLREMYAGREEKRREEKRREEKR